MGERGSGQANPRVATARETPSDEQHSQGGEHRSCRRCDGTEEVIKKYDINLCRRCFAEVARSVGFQTCEKSDHAERDSSVEEVPEGVLRGIRDIDESQTATKGDLEDALNF